LAEERALTDQASLDVMAIWIKCLTSAVER